MFTLYAFVRTADDFVDKIPQDASGFRAFSQNALARLDGKKSRTPDPIIDPFVALAKRRNFKRAWIVAFLNAMRADLTKKEYKSYTELREYMYGSAEVIGLMMARILSLPPESYRYAQAQGRAMQLINFIRDVHEDASMGRNYLLYSTIPRELKRYTSIQKLAEEGYCYIPKRYRIPIKTAADMYRWTAVQIANDPSVVYRKKVKPKPWRVVAKLVYNALTV